MNENEFKMNLRQFFTTNTWWGKLIGAFLGYLVAGPSGALIGILIGNFFDRGLAEHFASPHWYYHAEKREEVQRTFFEATFAIMGHIAKTDGRVSEEEINMAKTLMQEMGLNAVQRKTAVNFFNAGKESTFNLKAVLLNLKQTSHDNPELLKLFIDIQYRAAQIDGLSTQKLQVMDLIFQYLGFAPLHQQYRFYQDFMNRSTNQSYQSHQSSSDSNQQSYRQYRAQNSTLDQAYAILEVTPKSTKQEVKRAYRKLMSRNHPDKLIAKGLPEQMIKVANEKTQKISKAYDEICASKGW
jgi:DnaJ like chaperone protein